MADERTPHPHALPNYRFAVILREKLEKYCLDPQHVSLPYGKGSGKDKARVFKAVLGFEQADWQLLNDRILDALPYYEAVVKHQDEHGSRYTVEMAITGRNDQVAVIITGWIIRPGTDYPFLTTARCVSGGSDASYS